jgi:MOSC domain-containing protein YiiM
MIHVPSIEEGFMSALIEAMFAGAPGPLGPRGRTSAIRKAPLIGPWRIMRTGLSGDLQADVTNHGGPEKALHHYPRDHYAAWISETPELGPTLAEAPAFGENVSTLGLTEANVCIGDVMRAGKVVVQVSQGRQPCWKLNAKFDRSDMAQRVQETGRTGWYYRVIEEGSVAPGDRLEIIDRPQPAWPLSRIIGLLYHRPMAFDELAGLAELPELAHGWREIAARRIRSRSVENWGNRLRDER